MSFVPLLVLVAVFVLLWLFSNRAKQKRAGQEATRRAAMTVGTPVMTTSGLHATIVGFDPANDGGMADTAVIAVAPNVEVTWALAALRERPVRTGETPGSQAIQGQAIQGQAIQEQAMVGEPARAKAFPPDGSAAY